MKSILSGVFSLFLIFSMTSAAAQDIRIEQLNFNAGENGATIKGRIKGRQIIDYRLRAKKSHSRSSALRQAI